MTLGKKRRKKKRREEGRDKGKKEQNEIKEDRKWKKTSELMG